MHCLCDNVECAEYKRLVAKYEVILYDRFQILLLTGNVFVKKQIHSMHRALTVYNKLNSEAYNASFG